MFRTWLRRWRQRSASFSSAAASRGGLRHGICLEPLESRLAPAGHCWTGASGANSLWSDRDNWFDAPPLGCFGAPEGDPDATIIFGFPLPPNSFTSVYDLNQPIAGLNFQIGGIVLNSVLGRSIPIKADTPSAPSIAVLAGAINTIRSPLTLIGEGDHTVDFPGPAMRTLNIEGEIAGSENDRLAKSGAGELGLFGDNRFLGGVTLRPAMPPPMPPPPSIVAVGHDNALGRGTLTFAGGTLRATTGVTLANRFVVTTNGTITSLPSGATHPEIAFTGTGTLNAGTTLLVNSYGVTRFNGDLGGTGRVTVDAQRDPRIALGKVVLSGDNSRYGGRTSVLSGILAVTSYTALGQGDLYFSRDAFNPLAPPGGFLQADGADGTFQARRDFVTSTGPSAVALADVNGDGRIDLVVANAGSGNVTILLGNGDATFGNRRDFTAGTGPVALVLTDLNGDGRLDLVVANEGTAPTFSNGTVSVLLGNGNGTFQPRQDVPAGMRPSAVAVGDVNRDSRPDLVVANAMSNKVRVLLANGNGTFEAREFETGDQPSAVLVADVNRDGRPDLVVANFQDDTVSVLLGNGDGFFQARQDFAAGDGPSALLATELNGDGRLDLITANRVGNNVAVLLGNGDGSFQDPQLNERFFAAGNGPRAVALADVNGDGIADLATANSTGNTVSVLLGGVTIRNNWQIEAAGPTTATLGGNKTLTLTGIGRLGANTVVTLANTLGTLSLDGQLTGPGAIVKTNAGPARLTGSNDYTGTTTIRGGSLAVTNDSALGSCATAPPTPCLNLAGGTLRAETLRPEEGVTIDKPFQVSADSGIGGTSNITFSEPGAFAGAVTFTLTIINTATTTFLDPISGVGAIRIDVTDTGIVNFFGVSSYSGGTTLVTGTVTVNSNSSLGVGVVTLNGGAIQTNAAVTLPNAILVNGNTSITGTNNLTVTGGVTLLAPANTFTIRNSARTTFTNVINGSGQITMNAPAGSLDLRADNTYTGETTLVAGLLLVNRTLTFGTGRLNLNGGILQSTAVITLNNLFRVSGNPVIDAVNNLTFTGFGELFSGILTVQGGATTTFGNNAFFNISGAGSITKSGTGTLALTRNSNFTGGVTLNTGTLRVGNTDPDNPNPNPLGTGLFTVNGGTLQADKPLTLINSVNVNGNARISGTVALTFGGTGTMALAAGAGWTITNTSVTIINQVIRGAGGLTVSDGVTVLTAANTYTGITTVNGGTLLVNGTQPASAVLVTGATLGGVGVTGPVTLRGGTLKPGANAGPGSGLFRATGNVAFDSNSILQFELNGLRLGADFDQYVVAGAVDLNSDGVGGAQLDLRVSFLPTVGESFTLLPTTGGVRGTFRNQPENSLITVGDSTFQITYRGGPNGTDVVLKRILTNSTIVLLATPNPSVPGRTITFSAQVLAAGGATGTPTGTVTFFEGQTQLGTVVLVGGRAAFSASFFTVGTYNISATYSGDGNFSPAGPAQLLQAVRPDLAIPINNRFVSQLFRDQLGRDADSVGLAAFTRLLDQNLVTRAGAVLIIQSSREYRELFVRNLYRRILSREADAPGLAGWVDFLGKGGTTDRLQAILLDSQEFYQRFGGGTNDGFLTAVYQVVLGREVDNVGRPLWNARLAAGSSRGSIAEEILGSDESTRRRVDSAFRQYLRRPADTNALSGFAALVRGGSSLDQVIASVLASQEYYLRA